mmetsp:Transcript_387/g.1518  ORF Transcript_387/g.1518 Transcript_387/m.1518 type:complete len:377 (+) Transcript_387:1471-2601(+)
MTGSPDVKSARAALAAARAPAGPPGLVTRVSHGFAGEPFSFLGAPPTRRDTAEAGLGRSAGFKGEPLFCFFFDLDCDPNRGLVGDGAGDALNFGNEPTDALACFMRSARCFAASALRSKAAAAAASDFFVERGPTFGFGVTVSSSKSSDAFAFESVLDEPPTPSAFSRRALLSFTSSSNAVLSVLFISPCHRECAFVKLTSKQAGSSLGLGFASGGFFCFVVAKEKEDSAGVFAVVCSYVSLAAFASFASAVPSVAKRFASDRTAARSMASRAERETATPLFGKLSRSLEPIVFANASPTNPRLPPTEAPEKASALETASSRLDARVLFCFCLCFSAASISNPLNACSARLRPSRSRDLASVASNKSASCSEIKTR